MRRRKKRRKEKRAREKTSENTAEELTDEQSSGEAKGERSKGRGMEATNRGKFHIENSARTELPSKKHFAKLGELSRKGTSIWTQLKTGHVSLNKYLHRIKVVNSPKCAKCKTYDESVEHFLLHCKAYKQERITMKRKVKGGTKDIGKLLGNQHNAKSVVDYVVETGRLKWAKKKDGEEARQKAGRGGQQGGRGRDGGRCSERGKEEGLGISEGGKEAERESKEKSDTKQDMKTGGDQQSSES
jgi:hypothetical protein